MGSLVGGGPALGTAARCRDFRCSGRGGALSPPAARGRRRFCRGRPMCRPGHVPSRDPSAGGHIGPPLRGAGRYSGTNGNWRKNGPCQRGGTEPAPCRGIGADLWRLGAPGERRGEVTPPYGCTAGGAKQRADVGIGPYGEKGKFPQIPWVAAHSGAFAARVRGMGGKQSRDHPKRGHQPRTIPQSPSGRQLPLHKGAFGDGSTAGGAQQRADVVIGPYGDGGRHAGSSCPTGAESGRFWGNCETFPKHRRSKSAKKTEFVQKTGEFRWTFPARWCTIRRSMR